MIAVVSLSCPTQPSASHSRRNQFGSEVVVPLEHGYAVLIGTLVEHHRDRPDDQGRWYHVNLTVDVDGSIYRAAVDVDSKQSDTGVRWKLVQATADEIGPVPVGESGQHPLASAPSCGALDHIRHRVAAWLRIRWRRWGWFRLPLPVLQPWRTGSNLDASSMLESILAVGRTVMVWGEPFSVGRGIHNVHQNQGDPPGSQWWAENGIWQDGGVASLGSNGKYQLFLSKFSSQADQTNDRGHPLTQ
jgi:hypothetical protein